MRVSGVRRRWWVFRALGKNPLVRRADRVEAVAIMMAAIVALLVIPHVVTVGHNVREQTMQTADEQSRTRTQIEATVASEAPSPVAEDTSRVVSINWNAAGATHSGVIGSSRTAHVGDRVPIWIDQSGQRVAPPLSATSATTYGTSAAVALWLGIVALCGLVIAGIRKLLNHYRIQTWSAELRVLLDQGDGRARWHH